VKRIISFLMIFAVMVSNFCVSFAEGESVTGKREAEILKGLGIYESSEIAPTIRRADFVKIITKMMGAHESTISAPQKRIFTDVPLDSPDAALINYVFERGIMVGYDDASFRPDASLTCEEAAKILVSVLGYHELAEANGGCFTGYLQSASESGILKGVKINYSSQIDTGNLAIMIINTLEADMMNVDFSGGQITISAEKGTTMMGKYLNVGKFTGIVEGYENTSLESKDKAYGKNKGKIGGIDVISEKVDLEELLGMNVEVYYYDNNGETEVLYAGEKRNTYVVIESDNIVDAELSYINYYKDETGSRISDMDIESDAIFMYNGKRELVVSKDDLMPGLGNVKLIDNDGNGEADVVVITEYEEFVVKGVLATEEKVTTRYSEETLDFSDNENIRFFSNGEEADFSSVTKTSVLNIARSRNDSGDKIVKVYITDELLSGKVNSIKTDYEDKIAVIDGEEYIISKAFLKSVSEGKALMPSHSNSYEFRLNMAGEIAEVTTVVTGRQYAYVVKSYLEEEDEKTYVKLFTAEGEFVRIPAKEKVDLNGNRIEGKDLYSFLPKEQLIVYETDAEGNISKVKTAVDKTQETWSVAEGDEFILNSTTMKADGTFTGLRFYKNFAENKPYYFVNDKTICFQIPTDKSKEDEYKVVKKLSSTDVSLRGPLYIYDVQEGGDIGAIISGLSGGSTDYNTPQMVDRVAHTINEEDEPCTEIIFVDGSSVILSPKVKYSQPPTNDSKGGNNWSTRIDYSNVTAEDLKRGDVIQCRVVDGYVEELMVLVCVNNIGPVRIDGDHIAESGNTLATVLSVNKASSRALIYYVDRFGEARYQSAGIGGSVFRYDSETGKADYSTAADVRPGDTVLLNSFWWSIKATFIFR